MISRSLHESHPNNPDSGLEHENDDEAYFTVMSWAIPAPQIYVPQVLEVNKPSISDPSVADSLSVVPTVQVDPTPGDAKQVAGLLSTEELLNLRVFINAKPVKVFCPQVPRSHASERFYLQFDVTSGN